MCRPGHRRFLRGSALACVAFAAMLGCRRGEPITSWNSPRMLEIQKEWRSLWDAAEAMPPEESVAKYGRKNGGLISRAQQHYRNAPFSRRHAPIGRVVRLAASSRP